MEIVEFGVKTVGLLVFKHFQFTKVCCTEFYLCYKLWELRVRSTKEKVVMADPITTARTPFPPGRTCPECGSPVSRHDGLLYCIPRVGCPRDELTAWDAELAVADPAEMMETRNAR